MKDDFLSRGSSVPIEKEGNSPEPPQNSLIIEDATWRDFTQLHYLEKRCFKSDDLWPFWDLIGLLTLPGMIRLKAVSEDRMVGFIGGEIKPTRMIGWITNLAVLPDYRRLGIARALLAECEKVFQDMNAIRLSVRASNTAAIKLYEGAGYRQVDRWDRYYTGGEDALVFEKSR
jgi:ribosomal-protein-alanine N-acetyltransferase